VSSATAPVHDRRPCLPFTQGYPGPAHTEYAHRHGRDGRVRIPARAQILPRASGRHAPLPPRLTRRSRRARPTPPCLYPSQYAGPRCTTGGSCIPCPGHTCSQADYCELHCNCGQDSAHRSPQGRATTGPCDMPTSEPCQTRPQPKRHCYMHCSTVLTTAITPPVPVRLTQRGPLCGPRVTLVAHMLSAADSPCRTWVTRQPRTPGRAHACPSAIVAPSHSRTTAAPPFSCAEVALVGTEGASAFDVRIVCMLAKPATRVQAVSLPQVAPIRSSDTRSL
jgi:hypothetical protein